MINAGDILATLSTNWSIPCRSWLACQDSPVGLTATSRLALLTSIPIKMGDFVSVFISPSYSKIGPNLAGFGLKALATVRAFVHGTQRPTLQNGFLIPRGGRSAVSQYTILSIPINHYT